MVECGLSDEQFWDLTWYEYGIEILRLYSTSKRWNNITETILAAIRIQIADFRNVNRKKGATPTKPKDVFKLSFDDIEEKKSVPLSTSEVEKKFGKNGKK